MAAGPGLAVKMTADTAGISRGVSRTEKLLGQMTRSTKQATSAMRGLVAIEVGKAFVAGFSAVTRTVTSAANAIGNYVESVRESAQELTYLSQQAGTNEQVLQRMAAATATVGIDQEKLADILKDVNDRVGDFLQTGAGPMADFFEKIAPQIGLTADAFKGLSGPEALQLYVNGLQRANLNQQEFTFYLEAIASDATRLIPLLRDGGREMNVLGERAERLGIILETDQVQAINKMNRALGMVQKTFQGITGQVVATLAPAITEMTEEFLRFVEGFEGVGGAGGKGLARAIVDVSLSGIETFLSIVETVGKSLIFFAESVYAVASKISWLVPGFRGPADGAGAGGGGGGGGGWERQETLLERMGNWWRGGNAVDGMAEQLRTALEQSVGSGRAAITNLRQSLEAGKVPQQIEDEAGNTIAMFLRDGIRAARSRIERVFDSEKLFENIGTQVKDAFEKTRKQNEDLAKLYQDRDAIEKQRLENIGRLNNQALEVADIRAGGIGQFLALATGREDPGLAEARKQSQELQEINRNIQLLGGTVEIMGAA